MNLNSTNLQIVTIDAPYFTLRTSSLARELFGKVLGTRLNAYLQDYGEGVFPLGKEDFLSELVIICRKDREELTPVYSFKVTRLETCQKYNMPFPLTAMLRERYKDQKEMALLDQLLQEKMKTRTKLAYFGSRSKSVELNWNKESGSLLNLVGVSALVNYCKDHEIDEFILFAMLNNNAFKYCEKLGMDHVFEAPVVVDSLASSPGYVMHKTKFSLEALDTANQFLYYWNQRIHIGADTKEFLQTA